MKLRCRFCDRMITPWRFTMYLHAHKWTEDQHHATFGELPFLDAWCPGGQSRTRNV